MLRSSVPPPKSITMTFEKAFISLILEMYAEDDSLTNPFTLIPTCLAASSSSVLALAEKSTGIENTASLKSGLTDCTVSFTCFKNRVASTSPVNLSPLTTISRSVPSNDLKEVIIL